VASLQLKVPKERNPKFPKPDFVLSRALELPIIDLPAPP
jgi:hypothetical protein